MALSRRRDAWLLIGAAGAGVVLLIFVLTGLILAAKRKRAHSAVVAPPNRSILKKEREYATSGLDNTAFSTSETEIKVRDTIFVSLAIIKKSLFKLIVRVSVDLNLYAKCV